MSATDPYAAKGPKNASTEVEDELSYFLRRLEALGATPDEIDQVERTWDAFDGEWTPERRSELVRADDEVVVGMIRDARQEYEEGTTTEDRAQEDARKAGLMADARKAAQGTVKEALAWVGDDPERAAAVLAVETGPEGEDRSTLVRPLAEMVSDAGPGGLR